MTLFRAAACLLALAWGLDPAGAISSGATFRLRELLGLRRKTAVVSAVGSSFTLGTGFDTRRLAQ